MPLLGLILAPELYKASGIINYLVANAVNFGIYLLVFYFAVPKLLSANRYAFFYLGLLILVAASTFLKLELLDLIRERYPGQLFAISPEGSYYGRLILTFIFSLVFAFLGAFLRFTVDWFRNRQQMLKMDLEIKNAELAMLKYQMYPHFLFNTLNNIYALIRKGDKTAGDYMAKLSDILRYILYQSEEGMVKLSDEIEVIEAFIDLELLRKEEKGYLIFEKEIQNYDHLIPPMLFLPLVENAFKHGSGDKMPVIKVHCKSMDSLLEFEVENERIKRDNVKPEASGIGLINVRRRLDLSYRDRAEMTVLEEDKSFKVKIRIEF